MIPVVKSLITQLYKDTKIRVIKADTTAPIPSLPFGVYKVTSPYIKEAGMPNETYVNNEGSLSMIREESYKTSLSMNLYGKTDEEAMEKASIIRNWFTFHGEQFIQEQNAAVTRVGNIENRTSLLSDSAQGAKTGFEYRHGFDIQLRLSNTQIKVTDHFDTIEMGGVIT